jgi:multidrug efflux pump subunit AcrB
VGNWIAWWARNTVAANLLMVGIVISGILSFFAMEREVWPTFRINWVEVTVAWPGAAPQEVEEQIVIRIEESLADLDNVERLRSSAREGFAQIFIEANSKIDIGQFLSDVKLRVDSINSFPRDIEQPRVREILTRNEMIRLAVHGDVDERILKRTAERMRDEVALLPGASIVTLFGARQEEVAIELSEQAMRRYGLTFDEVAQAIRGSSINLSSGTVRTETGDIMLRARNLADNQEEFEKIIVRQTPDGAAIRIGDVARVVDGFEDIDILATLNGEPAILVQVMTTEKMNIVKTSEAVKEWVEEAKTRLPEGVGLSMWFDSSKTYFDRMETISKAATYGMLLVFLVLILSLRPKVALWVTAGIAVAFTGAFIFLPANDVSLNLLSLFAFLLVLGVVVDDAIVIGESIHRESMSSGGGVDNAILGTQLVAKPVIFAVLTTMIAFMPWLFLSGATVQFTRHISIIIIATLAFSLIEALFILPAHLSKLRPRTHMNRFGRLQKRIADGIITFAETRYRSMIAKALNRRYLTASIFIFFFVFSVGLSSSGWLKFSFMPEVENEMIIVNVVMPDGAPYSRALEILDQMQVAQRQLEEEVSQSASDGEGILIENWYTRARTDSVLALVQLAPPEERAMSAEQAAKRLRELIGDIPDADAVDVQWTINNQDPGLQYSVSSGSFEDLRAALDALKEKLMSYEDLYEVRDSLRSSTDEIRMNLKPGAEKLGLTLRDVSRQMRQAYFGEEVQRLPRGDGDVKVMVRYPRETRRTLESLANFRVRLTDGREIPLMAVVDVEFAPGLKRIERRERQRSAVISAELKDEVRRDIMKDLDDNFFPDWKKAHPGVTLGAVGQAEGEAQFLQEVMSLYLVALFAMYALIAIAFRSYWEPLLIMTAIPFAFMGAVYGHMAFGVSLALFSYFGIGAAAGVVVNDNLVLVDYLNRLRHNGMEPMQAIVEAGVARFRPILLTSVTTFVGLVPMMLERSTQAQFLKPTVIALAFGVAFALFVTLFLVPSLYGIGIDVQRRMSRIWLGVKRFFRPSYQPGE